mmetsp:Transcript_3120/g.2999  ORF Transcript_3120/g.2999 Transcript_3120/m.2999 type:complete len:81 (+) Transcript_3120:972-1214(+)
MNQNSIFFLLAEHGADVNIVYPELIYKPDLQVEEVEGAYSLEAPYSCTALINVVRHKQTIESHMIGNIEALLKYGARFDV